MVAVGFVVGLGYTNPYLSPVRGIPALQDPSGDPRRSSKAASASAYGARAISAGGLQSLPKLVFPGGALIGDDAGFLNASRIKGSHAAIKSGMLAAEAAFDALAAGRAGDELIGLSRSVPLELAARRAAPRAQLQAVDVARASTPARSWWASTRSCSAARRRGRCTTSTPTTRRSSRRRAFQPIAYPKPDGVLTFDRLSSVFVSNTNHDEDQPSHLTLKDPAIPIAVNLRGLRRARAALLPCGRVRVRRRDGATPRLQINAQNCVHCKTCDIKDPKQNIVWVAPEGGGGPNYPNM